MKTRQAKIAATGCSLAIFGKPLDKLAQACYISYTIFCTKMQRVITYHFAMPRVLQTPRATNRNYSGMFPVDGISNSNA